MSDLNVLKPKDLKSDQEVRWCPGCGDYAILNSVQRTLAGMGIPKENMVMVSGIGCSSRFPYYMDTYGFHSIHGRANAIATGVKSANPDLSVWVITGDGDGLSIGGNHMIHSLRRNVDLKIILFNNRIYGLTKGQYSPTTPIGTRTKTSPVGSIDRPFNPIQLALGAGATFVARTIDTKPKHMVSVLEAAAAHKGSAFVEVLQNCIIFNDGAWDKWTNKANRDENTVELVDGQPMIYGKDKDKGINFDSYHANSVSADKASVWTLEHNSPVPAFVASQLDDTPGMPIPIGVMRACNEPVYDQDVHTQIAQEVEKKGKGTLKDIIYAGDTWVVK
jgi:2-oxoglutarate ferredoxin oxidoreductase subunit beta